MRGGERVTPSYTVAWLTSIQLQSRSFILSNPHHQRKDFPADRVLAKLAAWCKTPYLMTKKRPSIWLILVDRLWVSLSSFVSGRLVA